MVPIVYISGVSSDSLVELQEALTEILEDSPVLQAVHEEVAGTLGEPITAMIALALVADWATKAAVSACRQGVIAWIKHHPDAKIAIEEDGQTTQQPVDIQEFEDRLKLMEDTPGSAQVKGGLDRPDASEPEGEAST